jgi:hypothetical protein
MADVTNLLIAAPAYGGSVKTACVDSLLRLQKRLAARGVKMRFDFTSYAEVAAVRNLFGTIMAENRVASHLLFVDTDMQFSPETVCRLIEAQKPVIGCFYARRTDEGGMVGVVDKPTRVGPEGIVEAEAVGMGLCLIQGDVFRDLAASGSLAEQTDHPFPGRISGPLLGFFTPPARTGPYMSEDIAFCHRWRDACGGRVFALVREDVGHVGDKIYRRNTEINLIVPPVPKPE